MTTPTVTTAATTSVHLREVAPARAGDKGNSSILLLRPYRPEDSPRLSEALTVSVLAQHFCTEPKHVIITAVRGAPQPVGWRSHRLLAHRPARKNTVRSPTGSDPATTVELTYDTAQDRV